MLLNFRDVFFFVSMAYPNFCATKKDESICLLSFFVSCPRIFVQLCSHFLKLIAGKPNTPPDVTPPKALLRGL